MVKLQALTNLRKYGSSQHLTHHSAVILPLPPAASIRDYLHERHLDTLDIDDFTHPEDPGGIADAYEEAFFRRQTLLSIPLNLNNDDKNAYILDDQDPTGIYILEGEEILGDGLNTPEMSNNEFDAEKVGEACEAQNNRLESINDSDNRDCFGGNVNGDDIGKEDVIDTSSLSAFSTTTPPHAPFTSSIGLIEAPKQTSLEYIGTVGFSPAPPSPLRGTKEYYEEDTLMYHAVTHTPKSRSINDYLTERFAKGAKQKRKNKNTTPLHQYHHSAL